MPSDEALARPLLRFDPSTRIQRREHCVSESEQEKTAREGGQRTPLDRQRLGGTDKDQQRETKREERRAPVSSSELSAGYSALTQDRGPQVNWVVFLIAA